MDLPERFFRMTVGATKLFYTNEEFVTEMQKGNRTKLHSRKLSCDQMTHKKSRCVWESLDPIGMFSCNLNSCPQKK